CSAGLKAIAAAERCNYSSYSKRADEVPTYLKPSAAPLRAKGSSIPERLLGYSGVWFIVKASLKVASYMHADTDGKLLYERLSDGLVPEFSSWRTCISSPFSGACRLTRSAIEWVLLSLPIEKFWVIKSQNTPSRKILRMHV
ncbi:hypothetical protein M419DRAFT_70059, partial [Trichoderma reesei RUT C-30]